ncbi:hypothetical protein [Synechococcus sp. PCC 7336]|uniref:hypothetical protein n=1 Tax=Synechococcus sp. PCC 7336 TaxID=195250 RepID=UPI0004758EAA|nr:hypothetical protein [Synechococcus sp. PCC 7336]
MFGKLQTATVRVAVKAPAPVLARCVTEAALLRQWVWPQRLDDRLPLQLELGSQFDSHLGPLHIGHQVEALEGDRMVLTLWGAIDGWNEWRWGNGWVQLHVEGVSLLPLRLGLSVTLNRLGAFARQQAESEQSGLD